MKSDSQILPEDALSRNERRKIKTKEMMRKAAIETFLELGFLKATVQDIMARADLGYGTFYKYYKSKQDVIVEIATEAMEMMTKDYKNPAVTERSLYYRTLDRMYNVLQTYAKHREVLRILRDCHTVDEELHRVWVSLLEVNSKIMRKELTWSFKRGICREVDLDIALLALDGMVLSVGNYIIDHNFTDEKIMKISEDAARLFEKAIFVVEAIPAELLEKRRSAF